VDDEVDDDDDDDDDDDGVVGMAVALAHESHKSKSQVSHRIDSVNGPLLPLQPSHELPFKPVTRPNACG